MSKLNQPKIPVDFLQKIDEYIDSYQEHEMNYKLIREHLFFANFKISLLIFNYVITFFSSQKNRP